MVRHSTYLDGHLITSNILSHLAVVRILTSLMIPEIIKIVMNKEASRMAWAEMFEWVIIISILWVVIWIVWEIYFHPWIFLPTIWFISEDSITNSIMAKIINKISQGIAYIIYLVRVLSILCMIIHKKCVKIFTIFVRFILSISLNIKKWVHATFVKM